MSLSGPYAQALKLADDHLVAGRWIEAAVAYQQVLAQNADLPDAWYNLGLALRRLGQFEAALSAYAQALTRGVRKPEDVHLNMAVILSDELHRPREAEQVLNAALSFDPDHASALLNLGNLCEEQGRLREALTAYERILVKFPWDVDALSRYISLRGITGPDDPWLRRAQEVVAHPQADASARAIVGFALGKSLDQLGDYAGAFDAFFEAHEAQRASRERVESPYDRKLEELKVTSIISAYPTPARSVSIPHGGPKPIFIVGMFRSGSTLVERVLSGHSNVATSGESLALPRLIQSKAQPFPMAAASLSRAGFDEIARSYIESMRSTFPSAGYVTDKRLDNLLYVGLIKQSFPDAKIILTHRFPMDNCLSVYFLHLDSSYRYAMDLLDIGHHYRQCRRLSDHWKALYGDEVFDFDYDEFVKGPREIAGRLLRYCGLEWDDRCLDLSRRDGIVKSASLWQVRQPVYQSSSGRWLRYADQLGSLRAYLSDILNRDESL